VFRIAASLFFTQDTGAAIYQSFLEGLMVVREFAALLGMVFGPLMMR
jgi:hypothetical protein